MSKPIPLESKPIYKKQSLNFDPKIQPCTDVAEVAMPSLSLLEDLDALRLRFGSPVVWQPEGELMRWSFKGVSDPVLIPAAVLMPLVVRPQGLFMLLTVRAAHLNQHAGQVSFPGGRVEKSDTSTSHTALRETEEEVGISQSAVELIGRLPSLATATGFSIQPHVGLVSPEFNLCIDQGEVADVFEVPLHFLMNPLNHKKHIVQMPGLDKRFYYSMTWSDYFIWGATAELIRNLYHFLCAKV